MFSLTVTKRDLFKIIEHLDEKERSSAYDYLYFLITRQEKRLTWQEIDCLPADATELSDEERIQFDAVEDYIAFEKVIEEYDL